VPVGGTQKSSSPTTPPGFATRLVRLIHSTEQTAAGRRAIPLDDRLVSELKAHKARQARERLVAGSAWEELDYLFVDELGNPYRPETLSRKFTKLAGDAGLRIIRPHDLRHTAASLMLAACESPKVLRRSSVTPLPPSLSTCTST
jgi:integrase